MSSVGFALLQSSEEILNRSCAVGHRLGFYMSFSRPLNSLLVCFSAVSFVIDDHLKSSFISLSFGVFAYLSNFLLTLFRLMIPVALLRSVACVTFLLCVLLLFSLPLPLITLVARAVWLALLDLATHGTHNQGSKRSSDLVQVRTPSLLYHVSPVFLNFIQVPVVPLEVYVALEIGDHSLTELFQELASAQATTTLVIINTVTKEASFTVVVLMQAPCSIAINRIVQRPKAHENDVLIFTESYTCSDA